VRVGETVRRPTGPWTPAVHELLRHLDRERFDGAPRAIGIDEAGREILTFVRGAVVWPAHYDLVASDDALVEVAATIRRLHETVARFEPPDAAPWAELARDPVGPPELLCHNDLAPWNLVRTDSGWVFIDWDLAAPGRRSWELAWALISFVPLWPDTEFDTTEVRRRARIFCDTVGCTFEHALLDVAIERCEREVEQITRLGAAGAAPHARLFAEGHADAWARTAAHIAAERHRWL
jgi:hypothetical protein